MVDQLSSGMIGTISTSITTEDNMAIYRDNQLSLVLHQIEEYEVQKL